MVHEEKIEKAGDHLKIARELLKSAVESGVDDCYVDDAIGNIEAGIRNLGRAR